MGKKLQELRKVFKKKKVFTEAQVLTVMNQIAVDDSVGNAEQKKRELALHFLENIALPYRGAIHMTSVGIVETDDCDTITTLAFSGGSVPTLRHKHGGTWW